MAGTSLMADAFRLAFSPLDPEAVLSLREGTAWRQLCSNDPGRFRPLCDIAALDAYLAAGARTPPVTMADGSRAGSAGLPAAEYAGEDGRIDTPRLFRRFDAGATLVVSQFHEAHPPLARFCRGLEKFFHHAVQANIYLTPPGAQGFKTHFDTHDVLVLQVRGEKRWRLHAAQPLPLPTRNTPWERALHAPTDRAEELVLRPGDALYVPRGTLHDAAAQDAGEASLHITIGLLEPSWADMLHDAIDLLEAESAAFRASLPSWRLSEEEGIAGLAAGATARLAPLADPALMERVVLRFLDRLAADRPALSGRGLIAPPPGHRDRLRLSDTVIHHLATEPDGRAALRWGGGIERLSPQEDAWLRRLEDGAAPEDLGQGALPFCRRLHAAGLLVREAA